MDQPRPCQKLFPFATVIKIAGVWLCLLSLWLAPRAVAQATPTPINPISTFQLQEGNNSVSWSQSSATVDSSTGNSLISFQDGNGGTSTMTWRSTGTLASWVIYPPSGSPQIYADAVAQGYPGSFTLTSGAFGTNSVLSINGHPYVPNGNFLMPAQKWNQFGLLPPCLGAFGYGGTTYNYISTGVDYSGTASGIFSNGTMTVVVTGTQGLQIYCPDGTCAIYSIDPGNRVYTYQKVSSAPNQLSQINGCPLTVSGGTLSLPLPISSFVCGGLTQTFSSLSWSTFVNIPGSASMTYSYTGGLYTQALIDLNGNLKQLFFETYSPQYEFEGITPGSIPNTYNLIVQNYPTVISAINGIPYVAQGNVLVPQGPVGTLGYGGSTYQFTRYSPASDGNWIAQYSTGGANPVTASVEYAPSNDAIVKMSINAPGGGTAVYVDGATVGQPGAYVWSNTSTAANSLTAVNNGTYNSSGDSDLPSTAQTTNGVFQIEGNFMSLGSWTNNSTQAGFDLSYYDSQTTAPANIEFTASRPSTAWLWDAATSDGTAVTPVMQLDQNSRLLLYAPDAVTAAGAVGPTPSVILDPSTTNPSDYTGVVRFEGPVRIAPQGDLSMGTFTQDAFPAQPTQ